MPALFFAILMTFWPSKFQGAWRESCWGNASHQLFSTLHDAYQDKFVELFMPSGPEGLETFWAQMSKHPACENHQLLLEPGYARKTIPVNIHGDCVPCTGIGKVWSKGLLALHWTSALSNGSSKTNCFSLFTAPLLH